MILSKLILKRGKDGFFSSDMKGNKMQKQEDEFKHSCNQKKPHIESEAELKNAKWSLFKK